VFHHMVFWALEATKGVQIPKQNQGLPFSFLCNIQNVFSCGIVSSLRQQYSGFHRFVSIWNYLTLEVIINLIVKIGRINPDIKICVVADDETSKTKFLDYNYPFSTGFSIPKYFLTFFTTWC
jgi:hypothetical protein